MAARLTALYSQCPEPEIQVHEGLHWKQPELLQAVCTGSCDSAVSKAGDTLLLLLLSFFPFRENLELHFVSHIPQGNV